MITYGFILLMPFWAEVKCPEPTIEIVDEKGLTWTDEDDKVIPRAAAGCIRNYGKKSCLIKLTKTGERTYHAVCRKYRTGD